MATTSIWAVKGWLGKVVLYIENPEKTENPQFYRQKNMTDVQVQNLSDVIDYAARLDKTTEALDSESVSVLRQLVSGINCLPATARDEMLAVKNHPRNEHHPQLDSTPQKCGVRKSIGHGTTKDRRYGASGCTC